MALPQPKKMSRATHWNEETEEAYRFQVAGYRDENEYIFIQNEPLVVRWPESGYVKKLQRKDGCWYYYSRARECADKDIPKCKLYAY